MNTQDILKIALETAGLSACPPDSGIMIEGENIKRIVAGIDMEEAEMVLAKELGADLAMTHHPRSGVPRANSWRVMTDQIDFMVSQGVPINKAQKILKGKNKSVELRAHPLNLERARDAAKQCGIALMGLHTPADMIVQNGIQKYLDEKFAGNDDVRLQDIIDALMEIPEYKNCLAPPVIRVGKPDSKAGRIHVNMAGGTDGGPDVMKAYFEAGVGTLVLMHVPDLNIEEAVKQNIGNIIVAGHMSSDSYGMNGFLKKLEAMGIEVIRVSGLIDYK